MVAWPDYPPPENGYRVIYVLDANAMFLTTVETVRSYQRRPDIASDPGALVVGIGYPPGSDILARRTWDLTMPVDEKRSRAPTGGAKEFFGFKIGRASLGKECVSTCRSRWSPYH